jgi:hypothetical protein
MSQREYEPVIRPADTDRFAAKPRGGWAIVDADGSTVVDNLPNRATAVRRLGPAASPDRPLPLRVVSPGGQPSGDMIG